MCHDNEEWCKMWRAFDLPFQNGLEEFDKFWPEHSKVSKICSLVGSLYTKYVMFELKKYKEVLFHGTEEWRKIWRKTDLWYGKLHEEFGKFWPEHSKVSNICTLMGSFWPKYIMFVLKKDRRVMFDGIEDRCKIWTNTDLCFPIWHEEFGKFSKAEK